MNKNVAVPVIIVLALALGIMVLLNQKAAVQMAAPNAVNQRAPQPAPAPGPQPGPQLGGGQVFSLDKLNGYAAEAGCPVLAPDDPAAKIFEQAECLGEKAVARGQK